MLLTYRVPELSAPVVGVAGSFLTAMQEFQAEGRGGPDDDTMIGAEIREWQRRWDTPEGFADYVAALRAQSEPDTPARRAGCPAPPGGGWMAVSDLPSPSRKREPGHLASPRAAGPVLGSPREFGTSTCWDVPSR
jgi:hypothetical protein